MFALALAISILPLLEAALITWSHYKVTHARQDVLSYCPTLLPRHKSLNARKMVRVAGVEPAWTCAQDMWVAATLHPDLKRGPCSPPVGGRCETRTRISRLQAVRNPLIRTDHLGREERINLS